MNLSDITREFDHLKDYSSFDMDKEWDDFQNKISEHDTPQEAKVVRFEKWHYAMVASFILIIGSLTVFYMNRMQTVPETLVSIPPEIVVPQMTEAVVDIPDEAKTVKAQLVEPTIVEPEPLVYVPKIEQSLQTVIAIPESEKPTPSVIEHKIPPVVDFVMYPQATTKTLSDGSIVEIAANSELKIPESFDGKDIRQIDIRSGEASFDVMSNDEQAFVVNTNSASVEVMGTVFIVGIQGENSTVENKEGKIKFYATGNEDISVVLGPGEKFVFDGKSIEPVVEEVKTFTQNIEAIHRRFVSNFSAFIKFPKRLIPDDIKDDVIDIPRIYGNPSSKSREVFNGLMDILDQEYEIELKEGTIGCEDCRLVIKSITKR